MIKINDNYRILKGWPKIKQYVDENFSSVPAYIVDRSVLEPYIITREQYKEIVEIREKIESDIEKVNRIGEETNNEKLKKIYNLNYMFFSDNENPPTMYDGEKILQVFREQTEIFEIEIDDYVKGLLQAHLESNVRLKTPMTRVTEGPIFVTKK